VWTYQREFQMANCEAELIRSWMLWTCYHQFAASECSELHGNNSHQ